MAISMNKELAETMLAMRDFSVGITRARCKAEEMIRLKKPDGACFDSLRKGYNIATKKIVIEILLRSGISSKLCDLVENAKPPTILPLEEEALIETLMDFIYRVEKLWYWVYDELMAVYREEG